MGRHVYRQPSEMSGFFEKEREPAKRQQGRIALGLHFEQSSWRNTQPSELLFPLSLSAHMNRQCDVGLGLQVAAVKASGRGGCQFLPQCSDVFSPSKLILPCAVEPCLIAIEC